MSNLSVVLHCSNYSNLFSIIKVSIYYAILLVFTLIANSRGHNVWSRSVKDTNFFAPAGQVPARQMVLQYPANFVPQIYAVPNMQQPMQGVPFQGSPLQSSPQPLSMQSPQGYFPQQSQVPISSLQTTPSDQMSSPQV